MPDLIEKLERLALRQEELEQRLARLVTLVERAADDLARTCRTDTAQKD